MIYENSTKHAYIYFFKRYIIIKFPWVYYLIKFFFRNLWKRISFSKIESSMRPKNTSISGKEPAKIPLAELRVFLEDWHIQEGDILMVHSCARGISPIDGSFEDIIDTFISLIGERGTLAMPAFPFFSKMNSGTIPCFDVRRTVSSTGLLSETLRRRPEAVRSKNVRAVVAIGARAMDLTCDHHKNPFPNGASSPYKRLAEWNAKILFIGIAPSEANTLLHCAEDLLGRAFPINVYAKEKQLMRIRDEQGLESVIEVARISDFASYLWDPILLNKYWSEDIVQKRTLKDVDFWIVDARKCLERLLQLANYGVTGYGYKFPDPDRLSFK